MTSSTSPSNRRGRGLAVIDTPPAPPGWEAARADLIRIVDPLGHAVAWLAPAYDGRVVGLAVRPTAEPGTPWRHVFGDSSPDDDHNAGCRVRCTLLLDSPFREIPLGNNWRFVERDPTAATMLASLADSVPYGLREAVRGLQLRFTAALNQGALELAATISNESHVDARFHLGLDLSFDGEIVHLEVGDGVSGVEHHLTGAGEFALVRVSGGEVTVSKGGMTRLSVSLGVTGVFGTS